MMQAVKRRMPDVIAVLLGMLLSLLLVPPIYYAWANILQAYEEKFPPVTATLASAEKIPPDSLRIQMYITRNETCRLVRVFAFSGSTADIMFPTPIKRSDGEDPVDYPVGMTVISVPWVLTSVRGPNVLVYGYYDCHGKIVRAQLVNESIP